MVENDGPRGPFGRRQVNEELKQYRLYFLEGIGSHISYSHEFLAADDDRAIAISEAWREGRRAAELWCGSRKVKVWDRPSEG